MASSMRLWCVAIAACAALASSAARAAEWGDLTGHFVVDGQAPAAAPLSITKNPEVCAKVKLFDESVTTDDKGNLANVVIFLRTEKPEIHPDYEKTAKDEVTLDNKNCRFEPHVAVLRTTQTLKLQNSDPVGHNTKCDPLNPANKPHAFNPILDANSSVKVNLPNEEKIPLKVGCNIHDWMGGYIVVRPDPYAAVTDKDGKFTIKNLPAGKDLEFQLWQEKAGYLKELDTKLGKVDTKGRIKLKIKPGANDLGDVKVPAKAFIK